MKGVGIFSTQTIYLHLKQTDSSEFFANNTTLPVLSMLVSKVFTAAKMLPPERFSLMISDKRV